MSKQRRKNDPGPALTPEQYASRQLEKGAERARLGLTDFTRQTHRADLEAMKANVGQNQADNFREKRQAGGALTGREREEERRRRKGR